VVVERVTTHSAEAATGGVAPVATPCRRLSTTRTADRRPGARFVEAGLLRFTLINGFVFLIDAAAWSVAARRALVGERRFGRKRHEHGQRRRAGVGQRAFYTRGHHDGVQRFELLQHRPGAQGARPFDDHVKLITNVLISSRLFLLRHEADELRGQPRAVEHRYTHRLGVEKVTRLGKANEVHLSYQSPCELSVVSYQLEVIAIEGAPGGFGPSPGTSILRHGQPALAGSRDRRLTDQTLDGAFGVSSLANEARI
jgi:hypothetical protein